MAGVPREKGGGWSPWWMKQIPGPDGADPEPYMYA